MKSERRSYADPCGVARALDVLGERWALLVVRELMLGPRRFGQLRDGLPGVSPNVLSQRLRELEGDGVLTRTDLEPPASVAVYELTERGRALEPLLLELGRWGSVVPRVVGRELSPASMLMALKALFRPDTDARVTYGLHLSGEHYRIAIAGGRIDITRGRATDADAYLDTDIGTLRLVTFLGTGVRAAESGGALTVTGNRRVAARFPSYFFQPGA